MVADDYDRECDEDNEEECLYTLSQDVQSAKSLESISAHMCNEYKSILEEHCNHFYKWDILYNKTLHAHLLQIMTQDCLDDIINLFLLDEIRTDVDRHYGNYFLYKSPNSQKFEGIMPIDMEEGEICYYSAKDFDKFVNGQYRSFLLSERIDYLSYADRLKQLRQEITKGNLPSKQIKFLRDCLNYDLPKKIKDICAIHNFNCLRNNTTLYDTTSKLWDYNHAELDEPLGL